MSSDSRATMLNTRRLKKREADRRAQRLARERTKNRISQLEATIERLRQTERGAQVSSILDQLSRVTKEKDNLLRALRSMRGMLQRHLESASPSNNCRISSENANNSCYNNDLRSNDLAVSSSSSPSPEILASPLEFGTIFSENLSESENWYGASQANIPCDGRVSVVNKENETQESEYSQALMMTDSQAHQPLTSYYGFVHPQSNLFESYWSQPQLVQGRNDDDFHGLHPCTMVMEPYQSADQIF
ncbi:hypothetical protein FSHL1_012741 [Fusarium sambucinum]